MRRLFYIFLVWIVPVMRLQAQSNVDSAAPNQVDTPKITVTKLDVNDTKLELTYEITNDTNNDIWICEDIDLMGFYFEIFMKEDKQTLVVRRRHDVPLSGFRNVPQGRYVRLHSGQTRKESLMLDLPILSRKVFYGGSKLKGIVNAKRMIIEIGYYPGNLQKMIFKHIEEAENMLQNGNISSQKDSRIFLEWFGNLSSFNDSFEDGLLRNRDEEIIIPWTHQILKGEQVLQIAIENLSLPYEDEYKWKKLPLPDLTDCERLEIQFQPSMLEYFYPYPNQYDLLITEEKLYLNSENICISTEQKNIKVFAQALKEGKIGGIIKEGPSASVTCYGNDNRLTWFTIYDDISIETEKKNRFWFPERLPCFRKLVPQIQPFELRVQCASNLCDLWYRLYCYTVISTKGTKVSSAKSEKMYPNPANWCDIMLQTHKDAKLDIEYALTPYICPGAGEGKCHYAMNPNCDPNSPGDMVLLFETKAGWNQHGGPELFTFDNHDPKGGCVLLNDGTVKFIRTEEELHALRWKQ
ncbi:MAG: hypothetical protein JW715_16610 [Sedimentisphaerales bacterium]|nr:hypothetical protein [Sedimentisphaerales bacterium]